MKKQTKISTVILKPQKQMNIPVCWLGWLSLFGCPLLLWFWTAGSATCSVLDSSVTWLVADIDRLISWTWSRQRRGWAWDLQLQSAVLLHAFLHTYIISVLFMWVPLPAPIIHYMFQLRRRSKKKSLRNLKSQVHESVLKLWWEQRSPVADLKDGNTSDVWHLLVFLSVCCAAVWP